MYNHGELECLSLAGLSSLVQCLRGSSESTGVNHLSGRGILKGEVSFTSCLTCLDQLVLQIKAKLDSCHTDDSKPVKQEVNGIVNLPFQYSLFRCSTLGQAPCLTHVHQTRLERPARNKHSSLLPAFKTNSCKKFYNIVPRKDTMARK